MGRDNINRVIFIGIFFLFVVTVGCLENPINTGTTNITVNIQSPSHVHEKEEFNIIVTIENTAINSQKFTSIDIASSYLEGISIISSDPPYDSKLKVPIYHTQCYFYDIVILGNEKIVINLSAVALTSGNYSGDMDICINADTDYLSKEVHTIVLAPE